MKKERKPTLPIYIQGKRTEILPVSMKLAATGLRRPLVTNGDGGPSPAPVQSSGPNPVQWPHSPDRLQ